MDDWGSTPGRCNDGIFLFAAASRSALGALSLLSNEYHTRVFNPAVKQAGREANHSPASS